MADYTELVKSLRYVAENHSTTSPEILTDAADAIEELEQTAEHYKGCADDWYKEACEYKAAVPTWIPVTERLPDKPGKYLVRYDMLGCVNSADTDILWFTDNLYQMNRYKFPGKKNSRPGFYSVENEYGEAEWNCVTHWMPLPEPPKEATE